MLDPITIGVNASFYMAPANTGLFVLNGDLAGGAKSKVIEAMIDVSAALEPCTVSLTGAYIMDIASKDDGGKNSGIKIGACAVFGIGDTGFSIIPGVIYTNLVKGASGDDIKASFFDIGVSLGYSF